MHKRFAAMAGVALALTAVSGAPGAAAATEVGSDCSAASSLPGSYTIFQTAKDPGSPLPTAAPAAGIVTRWRVNSALTYSIVERLRTFRATGMPDEFQVLAESDPEVVSPGQNIFESRIPVEADDLFGVYAASPLGVAFCATGNPADAIRVTVADAPVGSTQAFGVAAPIQVALAAVVETDADGDGYGDESQDACPQNASLQAPCPPVALEAFALPRRGSILVLVATSSEAPVGVTASVRYRTAKKRARKPKRGARTSRLVRMSAGQRAVKPGQVARFNLKFPARLKQDLRRLPRKRRLGVRIPVLATSLTGQVTQTRLTAKVRGQKRRRR